ncbi:hypothetical protein [Chryseobacterium sp. SL1]|uniref:hypothetical protein n=1 Tax=Chryseobacterium sp. SL1 TaxID=2995159 RepID=UPI002273E9D3|nr:hypothetical protein [Chryseobacterium sp. SL1]MCY1662634.1 hypothetical protein [Chryseobacterium sp. SL1]
MKKIILSAVFALSAVAFLPASSKAQDAMKSQSIPTTENSTNRAMAGPEPTNALAAWAAGYQYGMSHGWGHEDSLYWAKVQMKLWIIKHT